MNEYQLGTSVQIRNEFRNLAGALFDPSGVTCIVQKPDATKTTLVYGTNVALVKESTGVYYVWVATTQIGRWAYEFDGTGSQTVKASRAFKVTRSTVT